MELQREKYQPFPMTQPLEKGCIFHRTVELKQPHTITGRYELFLWNFRNQTSTISYDTAFQERRVAMRGYVFWGDSACSRYAHAWFAQVRNSWEGVRRIRDCVLGCVVILCVII